jgi:hypothetical protein
MDPLSFLVWRSENYKDEETFERNYESAVKSIQEWFIKEDKIFFDNPAIYHTEIISLLLNDISELKPKELESFGTDFFHLVVVENFQDKKINHPGVLFRMELKPVNKELKALILKFKKGSCKKIKELGIKICLN